MATNVFNPVKEDTGDVRAKRAIWTTKSVQMALDGLKSGKRLAVNPFYDNKVKLLKGDLVFERTEEEKKEWLKCRNDIIYFVETYCKFLTPQGIKNVELRDYQRNYLKHLSENNLSVYLACRQCGKCVNFTTLVNVKDIPVDKLKNASLSKYYINDEEGYLLPLFELYNLYDGSFRWHIKYLLYKYIYSLEHETRSDETTPGILDKIRNVIRGIKSCRILTKLLYKIIEWIDKTENDSEKLIHSFMTDGVQILTPAGFKPVSHIHQTKRFTQYIVRTTGHKLVCADEHIVYRNGEEIFVNELVAGDYIDTDCGPEQVIGIETIGNPVCMCDLTVDDDSHEYYTSGIRSHNTTTTGAFLLHYVCFNVDKNTMVVGNKRKTAIEILDKLKKMFVELPYFLKPGVYKWNDAEISFDNICRVQAEATTINSGIGQTLSLCLWDEAAHVAPNIIDKFYNNIFPTITAANAKFYISSTQNGRNLFYRLYTAAAQKDSDFRAFKTDWDEVPDWNPETQQWEKRDEVWHQRQVANYGSEEAFNSQFGTNFDISSNTLISQKKLKESKVTKFIIKDIYGVPYSENWYWHPDFDPMTDLKKSYIVTTCDLAEGIGQDYTVFSVFRMINHGTDDLECIGYFRANHIARERCAESLMSLYIKWCHPDHSLISFERNTYGEIFLKDINELADKKYPAWDPGFMVKYYTESGTKFHYGIKITSGNKTTHCIIFKESFERGKTIYEAEQFVYELQNFSDDGTGHYKASFGHDDMIMTAVQLEFVRKELQYRMMRDDFESGQSYQEDTIWNPYDTSSFAIPVYPVNYMTGVDDMNSLNRLQGNG